MDIKAINILCFVLIIVASLSYIKSRIDDSRSLKALIDEARHTKCMYLEYLNRHMERPVDAHNVKREQAVSELVQPLKSIEDLLRIDGIGIDLPNKLFSNLQKKETLDATLAVELIALREMEKAGGPLLRTGYCGIPERKILYHAIADSTRGEKTLECFVVDLPNDIYQEHESGYRSKSFKVIERDKHSIRVVIYDHDDTIGDTTRLTLPNTI